MKPFCLEAFKNGQKAMSACGGNEVSFLAISGNGKIVYEYDDGMVSCNSSIDVMERDFVMVSRHKALIDNYDPEDTWQWNPTLNENKHWEICDGIPLWNEKCKYRLHPHNDLIKAWKRGAKIEQVVTKLEDSYSFEGANTGIKLKTYYVDDPIPTWDEDKVYRIKPEPEFTYPILKQGIISGLVVKFTGLKAGEVIRPGIYPPHKVGHGHEDFIEHTNSKHWKDWTPPTETAPEPQTKTVYEWMCKTGSGEWILQVALLTEEKASEQRWIEYKKTGRSWEVEV